MAEQLKQILVPWHLKPFLCGIGVAVWTAVLTWLLITLPRDNPMQSNVVYAIAIFCCFTWIGILAHQLDK